MDAFVPIFTPKYLTEDLLVFKNQAIEISKVFNQHLKFPENSVYL